jgi:ABC-type branched-subunit amino acid transport system ATPase component
MLSVKGLQAGYGSAIVIRGVDLALGKGETLALVGRNGMGKTTFLKAMLGYLPNTKGTVKIAGNEVQGWPTSQIVRCGVAYAPQEEAIFGDLTVAENLDANMAGHAHSPVRRKTVLEYFPILQQRLRQHAGTLSGGEQKMLILARTLLSEAPILFVDEISAGLQPTMVATVERALRWERETHQTTILMVEQNLDLSLRIANRIAVMKLGQLVFDAPTHQDGLKDRLITELAP